MNKKAIILLSGGLDSTTVLSLAKSSGYDCYTLSFSYNQRHGVELEAAERIAKYFEVSEHRNFHLDVSQFGGSALTDKTIDVPDYNGSGEIPVTYVPSRNIIFLSVALGYAESIAAKDVFIGVSAVDYSGYPDCRPEFIEAFNTMANLGTKAGVEGNGFTIHTPLILLSKAETIRLGLSHGVDYSMTVSCYQANSRGEACGRCDSCVLRKKGFAEAGAPDPTIYFA